jgi:hypothetical protein
VTYPYMKPVSTTSLPKSLTLTQFIQTVFVGISGFPGQLVRPEWQPEPPKEPDLPVNWMAVGIKEAIPDANSYITLNSEEQGVSQRTKLLEVTCSIYGPECVDNYMLLVDGFQVPANLWSLFQANMGFVEVTRAVRMPDFVNERWIDRIVTSVFLRYLEQRTYPILSFTSASGQIYIPDISTDFFLNWGVVT